MSVFGRLARGETSYDFVGRRRTFYLVSAVVVLICIGSMVFRGFNFGIEFSGGTEFQTPSPAGTTVEQAQGAVESQNIRVVSAQETGIGYLIRTEEISQAEVQKATNALAESLDVPAGDISDASVSASWGSQVSRQALIGLVAFLVAVSVYISFRFEPLMALSAIIALIHDLVISMGVYSIVGFEVSPATAIGLLTILGFSLYDTVVVFDKVDENTRGILGQSRHTYGERANLAVNQVLMRSINTSIIALLPVAALLVVGAGLLGAGTLKDLALVLLVGTAAGAYSSIFIATPALVDLKLRQPSYRALEMRVLARRSGGAGKGPRAAAMATAVSATAVSATAGSATAGSASAVSATAGSASAGSASGTSPEAVPSAAASVHDKDVVEEASRNVAGAPSEAPLVPRPGARPNRERGPRSGRRGH